MTTTTVLIRVIAAGGKFLGDDIGGAAIVVRDFLSKEILDQGVTQGSSGKAAVMCTAFTRMDKIPDDTASGFTAQLLNMTAPRQIEITAYGPLAARGSANTASVTTWVFPGQNIPPLLQDQTKMGNGIVLELPGLICQIISPVTHSKLNTKDNQTTARDVSIVANVAMMCGCPISSKKKEADQICSNSSRQPWLDTDFVVSAVIPGFGGSPVKLKWDCESDTPGRFIGTASNVDVSTSSYQMTVWAQQISTGNTGVDLVAFMVVQPPPPLS